MGQPIQNAEVAWHTEDNQQKELSWSASKGIGLILEIPQQRSTFFAQAEGYWSDGATWVPGETKAQTLHITLAKVVDYQAIICLDSKTKEPVAGVRFRCPDSTAQKKFAAGEWESNVDGIVRIPRAQQFRLAFLSEVPAQSDYAPMKYWIYPGTDTIEIFHQGVGTISVVDDAGDPLPGVMVGAYAVDSDFPGGASGRFQGTEQTTDEKGQASCSLLLDVEHRFWAKDAQLGYAQKRITPKESGEQIRFQLTPQPPLVLQVDLPPGVERQSLKVEVKRSIKMSELLKQDEDGLFTLDSPTLSHRVRVSADGCVTVDGYLRSRPKGSSMDPNFSGGYVSLRLRRGYEIDGRAIWADGEPAEATLGLYVLDDDRPPYEVVDRKSATGWRWMEHHPLVAARTGPQGAFHFFGLPEATYYLDQILEDKPSQDGYAVWLATCSFTESENYMVVPEDNNPVIVLPRFQETSIRAIDSVSQSPISSFVVQRVLPEDADGFCGSSAKGSNGRFEGWMAVDHLDLLEVTADGYLPIFLDNAAVQRNADVWQMEVEMQPINPGRMTVYFEPPEGDLNFRAQIYIKATEPRYWAETLFFENGVAREINIPTAGDAVVKFAVLSVEYALDENHWDYHAGESFSLYLTKQATEK
ncbi:MAG: hypothetical protein QM477_09720 [Planctomycetota bacterium]